MFLNIPYFLFSDFNFCFSIFYTLLSIPLKSCHSPTKFANTAQQSTFHLLTHLICKIVFLVCFQGGIFSLLVHPEGLD